MIDHKETASDILEPIKNITCPPNTYVVNGVEREIGHTFKISLDHLIDRDAFIEKLEAIRREPDEWGYTSKDRVVHSLAIDATIKLAKGEKQ